MNKFILKMQCGWNNGPAGSTDISQFQGPLYKPDLSLSVWSFR